MRRERSLDDGHPRVTPGRLHCVQDTVALLCFEICCVHSTSTDSATVHSLWVRD
ncbi:hypothetical protein BDZ91DRAFT_732593 [Kalaharituber pfeilii]|nr:hypothetical protein BDZ91DRAFT_732593 [Kalaharituber pfeilii]